jgi:hypothetical protein
MWEDRIYRSIGGGRFLSEAASRSVQSGSSEEKTSIGFFFRVGVGFILQLGRLGPGEKKIEISRLHSGESRREESEGEEFVPVLHVIIVIHLSQ